MDRPEITVLYKYRNVSERSLDLLRRALIRYSRPATLNDPYDAAGRWKTVFTDKEILEDYVMLREAGSKVTGIADKIRELLDQGHTHSQVLAFLDRMFLPIDGKTQREMLMDVLEYNEAIFSQMGILSLSECPNQPLMWAHYADSHKGFCLGFAREETNVLGQYADPVEYRDTFPMPKIAHFKNDAGLQIIHDIAYTKSRDWEYEREWRVVKQQGDEEYPYPGRLVEVIFGLNTENQHREEISAIVLDRGVRCRRIEKTSGDYALAVGDIQ